MDCLVQKFVKGLDESLQSVLDQQEVEDIKVNSRSLKLLDWTKEQHGSLVQTVRGGGGKKPPKPL